MSGARLAVEFDERRIDAIFAELDQCRLPGVAVGIAVGGKPVYRKGFGLASMELPVVLTPTTRMRIQSTSKHFACLAYLLLCEAGAAGIDDPLGKYLPELHPVTHGVTMRQLMNNTSGLYDAHTIRFAFSGMELEVPTKDVVDLYRNLSEVNFPPGASWCYINGGFELLSMAIERIAGESLEEVMRKRIFEPIGMHDSLLRRCSYAFVPNSATNHRLTPEGRFVREFPWTSAGSGGVASTVDDMLRWLAHMDAPVVGSAATWTELKTPTRLCNGTVTNYGLGLYCQKYRGVETLCHAGGNSGSNSQMLKVPAAGLDIEVMANRSDVASAGLVARILDACLPELEPVRRPFEGPFATGTFRSPLTGRVIQLQGPSTLPPYYMEPHQVASIDGNNLLLEPDDDGVLRPVGMASHIQRAVTLIGDREHPSALRFSDYGNVDELVPVLPADGADARGIVGRYRSVVTDTAAVILCTDQGARLRTIGHFGSAEYRLESIGQGLWKGVGAAKIPEEFASILSFDAELGAFDLSAYGVRVVQFQRIA